jgi:hypothetical protein
MRIKEKEMKAPNTILALVATAALLGGTTMIFVAKSAHAKPEFVAQSGGKACGACHQNPAGTGPLTPAGEDYKKTIKK